MNDLQTRKRKLLAQSAICRQQLSMELAHIEAATAWIPKTLQFARMVSPILAIAAPLAGWFFRPRKRPAGRALPSKKRNLFGKMLAGYQVARQVKPVWDGFRRTRAHH